MQEDCSDRKSKNCEAEDRELGSLYRVHGLTPSTAAIVCRGAAVHRQISCASALVNFADECIGVYVMGGMSPSVTSLQIASRTLLLLSEA
jgi:hypothetical protein